MKENMLVFREKETHTEIRYVIAYYAKKMWYRYLDFPNIDDAKEHIAKIREKHPNRKYALFEEIEHETMNKMDEEYI